VLTRADIARLVPHQGAMCLLDGVAAWDREGIRAIALSHRDPANPLRRDGTLPAVCGLEYALQAMALHAALLAGGRAPQRAGFLASLRGVDLGAERLDDVPGPLLVTGGGSPIGAAICRALAAGGGLHVVVHAHANPARAEAVAAEIAAAGGSAEVARFDVADFAAAAAAAERLLAARGPVQVLVHNAGTHDDAPMAGMTETQWRSVLDVSLNGFFNVARPLLLPMIGTRWGRIVAMSSLSGIMGNRGQANYAAAKAGLIGAVRALSLECAPRGVTVNAVAPGIIDSPAVSAAGLTRERIRALVPARRAGTPEEVAHLVAFLASDRAAYITGQCISINGGLA